MYDNTHTYTRTHISYVASLIELLKEVLDAEQSLFGKRVRPLKEWLQRYLKVSECE